MEMYKIFKVIIKYSNFFDTEHFMRLLSTEYDFNLCVLHKANTLRDQFLKTFVAIFCFIIWKKKQFQLKRE